MLLGAFLPEPASGFTPPSPPSSLPQPHSEAGGVQSEDQNALCLLGPEMCCWHLQAHANDVVYVLSLSILTYPAI